MTKIRLKFSSSIALFLADFFFYSPQKKNIKFSRIHYQNDLVFSYFPLYSSSLFLKIKKEFLNIIEKSKILFPKINLKNSKILEFLLK